MRTELPAPRSQCDVMADLLADGRWHTINELFQHGIGRPNSRASELRTKRGLTIEHDYNPAADTPSQAHRYRLITDDPPATQDGQLLLAVAA